MEILLETYLNLLPSDEEKKHKHKHEVFKLIKDAYASQGGIHGKGFDTPDDMVKHIDMWKVHKKGGKVIAAALYRDKGQGRKRVAIASDGSSEGKNAAGKIMSEDFSRNRAHAEVSGKSLSFLKKQMNISAHVKSFEYAKKYHAESGDKVERPSDNDPEVIRHPELKDHFYTREIGGHQHTKIMLGTTGKNIE